MVAPIDTVALALLDEAIEIYEKDGTVIPATFVMGHSRVIFAQPFDDRGLRLPRQARTAMDALLISAVDAVYLGRIDESFMQERTAYDPAPDANELAQLAETDPTVRTAISVQAIDTRTRRTVIAVARDIVADDNFDDWEVRLYANPEGRSVIDAVEACAMATGITDPLPDAQLRDEINALGWEWLDSDDMVTEGAE